MHSIFSKKRFISIKTCGYFFVLTAPVAIASNLASPQSGFFLGAGGSGSSVSFFNQQVYAIGTSYSPPYGNNTAQTGSALGSTSPSLDAKFGLAPLVQAGYYNHISHTDWIWGGKFSYSYVNLGSAQSALTIPQAGGFYENGTYTPFTGNYLVQSFRQNVNHQLSLIPFAGRSFKNSQFYLGLGPMTAQTKTTIQDITGFENVKIVPTTPTGIGLGKTYTTSQWLFGGVAMVGSTFFVDQTSFIDVSYSYSITGSVTRNWGGAWADTDTSRSNVTRTGTNTGTTSGRINTQFLAITFNKVF
jgi:hypothetical protein